MKTLESTRWYKDAIIYQLHVRAFHDHDGDGIGDFQGLVRKLDYVRDLGVTALWLLPFYPSPLRDDGYDIADYRNIHSAYGTLRDFKLLLKEAHARDLRVITELVINHTSDQHEWFQRSRRAEPGSRWRNFYVWENDAERYSDARIIFKDFETSNWEWDPTAGAYFWHRFYKHQPDLNFDNPEVAEEVIKILDFWMEMGVDGFRLDAVPYLFERDGTTCENLPETHLFLKKLRKHVDKHHAGRMLLAEANQWPEDAAAYFGDGDECHMNFHFPLMPRLFMAVQREDRFPIIDILEQTPDVDDACQWALFLRNHDELTLEMVTDEERDYMYRSYADDPRARINLGIRRRLAPLLGNDRRKIELLNGLLFSLPGTPIIYYGDEIGMGDNIYLGDRDSVRTPMQWSPDRNAGFSRANPQRLFLPVIVDPEFHYSAVSVEAQENNPQSLLWWMRRLTALRKRYPVFGRGTLEFLFPDNSKVLAFLRKHEHETILVVANLSRHAQYLEIDLSPYQGMVPVELFGQTRFPPVGELPYLLTLSPHAFYWFSLVPQVCEIPERTEKALSVVRVRADLQQVFHGRARTSLEAALSDYVARITPVDYPAVSSVALKDVIPLGPDREHRTYLAVIQAKGDGSEETTLAIPLSFASGNQATRLFQNHPEAAIARLTLAEPAETGIVFDGTYGPAVCLEWMDAIVHRRKAKGERSELFTTSSRELRSLRKAEGDRELGMPSSADAREMTSERLRILPGGVRPRHESPELVRSDRADLTDVVYAEKLNLRLFRYLDPGPNPDLEISQFLQSRTQFRRFPRLVGQVEIEFPKRGKSTVAILREHISNEGTAWEVLLDNLRRFFERVLAPGSERETRPELPSARPLLEGAGDERPDWELEFNANSLEVASEIGRLTGEMHLALGSATGDPDFQPEAFSTFYQRSLFQSMSSTGKLTFRALRKRIASLPAQSREAAERLLTRGDEILQHYDKVRTTRLHTARIRCHGQYRLTKLLYTGRDFVVTDFRGDPRRSLGERRIKRSPLRDVAAMLRSFEVVAHRSLDAEVFALGDQPAMIDILTHWAGYWCESTAREFLKSYQQTIGDSPLIPEGSEERRLLLTALLLDEAIQELFDALQHDTTALHVPIIGIERILDVGV